MRRKIQWSVLLAAVLTVSASGDQSKPPQQRVAERQASLSKMKEHERAEAYAKLALDLAELAGDQYEAGEIEGGHQTIAQVVEAAQKAHAAATMKRKKIKQAEINLRRCENKLTSILRSLSSIDQAPVKQALAQVEKLRAETLEAMFAR